MRTQFHISTILFVGIQSASSLSSMAVRTPRPIAGWDVCRKKLVEFSKDKSGVAHIDKACIISLETGEVIILIHLRSG